MDDERKRELKRGYREQQKAAARQAMVFNEDQLNELLDYLDARVPETGCDYTLRLTRAWSAEHGVDPDVLASSVEEFGGYCDCEVLANIDPDAVF